MTEVKRGCCLSVCWQGKADGRTVKSSILELARNGLAKRKAGSPSVPDFTRLTGWVLVQEWFGIALQEGHVEPSQPCVGRLIGWPQRIMTPRSLLVDFQGWCVKQGYREDSECDDSFAIVMRQIFNIKEERVFFPPLEECRHRFEKIGGQYDESKAN